MTDPSIEVVAHDALGARDFDQLGRLFDREYFYDFGPWGPDQQYGYAPHDRHVICRSGDDVVGHVGWARRVSNSLTSYYLGVRWTLCSPERM